MQLHAVDVMLAAAGVMLAAVGLMLAPDGLMLDPAGRAVAAAVLNEAIMWIINYRAERRLAMKALERELRLRVIDGRDCRPNLDRFKPQLSTQYIMRARDIGYVHLKKARKWYENKKLKDMGPGVIMSGPSEICLQELAMDVAKYYEAKLLILDLSEFNAMMWYKYRTTLQTKRKWNYPRLPNQADEGSKNKLKADEPYDDKLMIKSLERVIRSFSSQPFLLYIRNCDDFMSTRIYTSFQTTIKGMDEYRLLIFGSRMRNSSCKSNSYPFNLAIRSRYMVNGLIHPLEKDEEKMRLRDDRNIIIEKLGRFDVRCYDLNKLSRENIQRIVGGDVEEAVLMAIAHHLKNNSRGDDSITISSESLTLCLHLSPEPPRVEVNQKEPVVSPRVKVYQNELVVSDGRPDLGLRDKNDDEVHTSIGEIIPPSRISVTFQDIGALDSVKMVVHEAIIDRLKRPSLYKSHLLQPCCGLLLFGPPGTGKTMVAKAIAKEANATFISVTPSSILSSMFAGSFHNVRDLFMRANKLSPTIIFIDEVDGLLGRREKDGNDTYRNIKNEFMTLWDGIATEKKNVIILGATNRPFDLDDAIVRRFDRRIYVGLPCLQGREMILEKIMKEEDVEDLHYSHLAKLTPKYSASDLKNLCTRAAFIRLKEQEKNREGEECMKPFKTEHFIEALKQVSPSHSDTIVLQLKAWNDKFGEQKSKKTDDEIPFYIG